MEELRDCIAKKVKGFNPNKDEESEFDTTEKISWWKIVRRHMSTADTLKFATGCFTSAMLGAALPAFCLVFGEMIDGVADTSSSNGNDSEFNALQKQAFFMLYIGCGLFFIGWSQVGFLT